MASSVASTSFVNLFKTRPEGVDSKNRKLLRITENSSLLCRVLDEVTTMAMKKTAAHNAIKA
jgi:hypothetical protein